MLQRRRATPKRLNMTPAHIWTSAHRTYTIQVSNTGNLQLSEGESRMSSLSRRACYKCGNVGHYAEVCSSSERLCYNCKQPGEPKSWDADTGRDTDRCSKVTRATTAHTQGQLRVSLLCLPYTFGEKHTLTMDPAKQCYHCQGLGHVQADCPTLRLSGGPPGGRCYSCGQAGHLAVCLSRWYE